MTTLPIDHSSQEELALWLISRYGTGDYLPHGIKTLTYESYRILVIEQGERWRIYNRWEDFEDPATWWVDIDDDLSEKELTELILKFG